MQNDIIKRPPPEPEMRAPVVQVLEKPPEGVADAPTQVQKIDDIKKPEPKDENLEPKPKEKKRKKKSKKEQKIVENNDSQQVAPMNQQASATKTASGPGVAIFMAILFCLIAVGITIYAQMSKN